MILSYLSAVRHLHLTAGHKHPLKDTVQLELVLKGVSLFQSHIVWLLIAIKIAQEVVVIYVWQLYMLLYDALLIANFIGNFGMSNCTTINCTS